MMTIGVGQIIVIILTILIFLVPPIKVLLSSKTRGWQKFVWFLLSGALSWIGYFGFYHLVVKNSEHSEESEPSDHNPFD